MRTGKGVGTVIALLLAATISPVAAQGSVDELTRLNDETVLLKARTSKAEAQSALRKAAGDTSSDRENRVFAPVVSGVFGRGGRNFAQFRYPNGVQVDAYPGEMIDGGYRVESVNVECVAVRKHGKRWCMGSAALPLLPTPRAPASATTAAAATPTVPPLNATQGEGQQ